MTPDKLRISILELATVTSDSSISETFNKSLDLARKAEEFGLSKCFNVILIIKKLLLRNE